jgi:hypothetical protein
MSCCIELWKAKCLKRGDTTRERIIWFPFDITDCTFLMQFRKIMMGQNTNPVAFSWATGNPVGSQFVRSEDDDYVEDEVTYMAIKMDAQAIDVEPSMYVSDMQMTEADGTTIRTLFDVELKIVEDYSREA